MIERTTYDDLRSEPRSSRCGRVRWRRTRSASTFPGWLSDGAPTSLSFITPTHTGPGRGDEIEVLRESAPPQRYRVTRLAPYDANVSLVACRMLGVPVAPGSATGARLRKEAPR